MSIPTTWVMRCGSTVLIHFRSLNVFGLTARIVFLGTLIGGALGEDINNIYYWPPDRLEWEPVNIGFTDLFCWSLTSKLADFYVDLHWPNWKFDIQDLHGDQCFGFYLFLWTKEGSVTGSLRRAVPVAEAFDQKVDIIRQF